MKELLPYNENDGGRSKYFKASSVGDCVTRAIAIASGRDYKEVYDELFAIAKKSPRNGVKMSATKKYMKAHGFEWHATSGIGVGIKANLCKGDLPEQGAIVCRLSGHLVAVVDGVVQDTYDSRTNTINGKYRGVYGYWSITPTSDNPTTSKATSKKKAAKRNTSKKTNKFTPRKRNKPTQEPCDKIDDKFFTQVSNMLKYMSAWPGTLTRKYGPMTKEEYDKIFYALSDVFDKYNDKIQ